MELDTGSLIVVVATAVIGLAVVGKEAAVVVSSVEIVETIGAGRDASL